jgi:hypothetical protein
MHCRQEPRGLSRRSRDRRRHRLHPGDRPHPRIRQARLVRTRSQARARRQHRHAHAAQAGQRRCVQTLFAGGDVALCAPLAPVPHPERRFSRSQYPSRGHTASRYSAAGLCGALQRGDSSDRRGMPSSPTTSCATSGPSWAGKMRRKRCSRAGRSSGEWSPGLHAS